jgi:hypothetical protein
MSVEARLQRMERKLDALNNPKPKWVRSRVITELTGWTPRRLQTARDNSEISFKCEGDKYLYDLNTLHPYFIKRQTA